MKDYFPFGQIIEVLNIAVKKHVYVGDWQVKEPQTSTTSSPAPAISELYY